MGSLAWLLAPVAVLVVLAVPFVSINVWRWWRRGVGRPTHVALTALFLSISAAVAVGAVLAVAAGGVQSFARSGLAKSVTLPLVYSIFAVALLVHPVSARSRVRKPVWWYMLGAILGVSTILEIVVQRQELNASGLAQGVAFIVGILLCSAVGMRAEAWNQREIVAFAGVTSAVALLTQYTELNTTPFSVLQVPAGFMMLYFSVKESRFRLLSAVVALALLWPNIGYAFEDANASIAIIAQIFGCLFVFVVAVLPRLWRNLALLVATLGLVYGLATSGITRMFFGATDPSWDVTLAHRAYETRTVFDLVSDPVTFLFGMGPGATVDLSRSPDLRTLISSGRDIAAVDDVHLLTSWIILKFGAIGIVWFIFFSVGIGILAARSFDRSREFNFNVVLLLFVTAAVLAAIPAATYLFSNPMMAFCIGALIARQNSKSVDASREAVVSPALRV